MNSDPVNKELIVIGIVSKRKLTFLFILIMLISLFFTFHVLLYDSTIYSIQAATIISNNKIVPTIAPRFKKIKFSPYHIHFPKTSRKLPQCLIIGVRKCGTRALLEMLNLHPQIQKSAGEVHFFDRDENYSKGLEWYRKKMPHSFKGQITIEKSPSYVVTPEVAERVRAMNSSIKLLLIVREPVTRAISDFTQLRSHSATAVLPTNQLTQASSSSPNTKSFEELAIFANGTININYRPLALSIYHQYTLRWLEIFSRSQILVVNGDQLITDPLSQINRVQDFLGIERRINHENFYFNKTKGFYCLRTEMGDKKCLKETKGRMHPKVNERSISILRKFFVEHNQKFYDLIGEDLGWPEE